MRLLVAGADRADAGKTTFSVGLLARLRADGAAPLGVKPRAGNDWWFDHDDAREALAAGRLHGTDAARLAAASAGDQRVGAINPLHRLWRPTPGESGLLGEPGRTFLLDRLTLPGGESFVVNGGAEAAGLLPECVRDALPLSGARRVESVAAFNDLMADRHLPALRRTAERVERVPAAVVESYADVALPLPDVAFDAVAVVEPGRVRVYDGERYVRAREIGGGSPRDGAIEERVGDVVAMVEPGATVALPALPEAVRTDPAAVAEANADAYDALLAAV